MSEPARILAFAGSARRESLNRKLLDIAADGARAAGAQVSVVDLRDHPLPLYDGDLEQESGLPEPAVALRALMASHRGLLLACPEYNSSITPLLKNTLDWISRSPEAGQDLSPFAGKVVALLSASPGALGGLRGLVHVRSILTNVGCLVLPEQLTLRQAGGAFGADGALLDEARQRQVAAHGAALAAFVSRLGTP